MASIVPSRFLVPMKVTGMSAYKVVGNLVGEKATVDRILVAPRSYNVNSDS